MSSRARARSLARWIPCSKEGRQTRSLHKARVLLTVEVAMEKAAVPNGANKQVPPEEADASHRTRFSLMRRLLSPAKWTEGKRKRKKGCERGSTREEKASNRTNTSRQVPTRTAGLAPTGKAQKKSTYPAKGWHEAFGKCMTTLCRVALVLTGMLRTMACRGICLSQLTCVPTCVPASHDQHAHANAHIAIK